MQGLQKFLKQLHQQQASFAESPRLVAMHAEVVRYAVRMQDTAHTAKQHLSACSVCSLCECRCFRAQRTRSESSLSLYPM